MQTSDPLRLMAAVGDLHHPRLPTVAIDPTMPLTAEAAGVIAILVHPQLRVARAQRGLADAQVLQAGVLPNPQLSGGLDRPITGDTGAANLGWSIGLSWEVTAFISRGAKQRSAIANREAIDLAIAWQEWQVAAAARQAVVRLAGARERLPLVMAQEQLAHDNHALHHRAQIQGLINNDTLLPFAIALSEAHAARLDAESEIEHERLLAVRALGFPVDHPLPVATLPTPVELGETLPTTSEAQLEVQRLDLIGLRAGYVAQEETLHADVLGQFPKITLGLTRALDNSQLGLLSPGIGIDLPFFDRNQSAIANSSADRDRLRAEYIARVFEARHDLGEARSEFAAAMARWHDALSALDQAANREQQTIAAAHLDFADAPTTRAATSDRLRRALDASLWHQRACELRIAIELAAGCLLPTAVSPSDAPTTKAAL